MAYEKTKIRDGIWAIQDGQVRMYLLDGGRQSFLIDTGYGSGDLKAYVSSIAGGDIIVVHTHMHGDHTSGDGQFAAFYMSRADADMIRSKCPAGAAIHYLEDGDIISAGEMTLEAVAIPGHTPGSMAFLDRKDRILFSSDSFAKNFPIYMQFPGQSLTDYLASMEKMQSLDSSYDTICPMHGELDIDKSYIPRTITCCRRILDGTVEVGTAKTSDGTQSRAGWYEGIAIFF